MMDLAFFESHFDAWNAHDSAAVARYMADDAIYEDVAKRISRSHARAGRRSA